MNGLSKFLPMTLLTGAMLMAAGCAVYPEGQGGYYDNSGPPPHSARNGYQRPYGGHDVRYDARLGVYLVVGMPDYYYLDNYYYRYDRHRNNWYYSQNLKRDWRNYDERRLPPGLAKKYARRDEPRYRNRAWDY